MSRRVVCSALWFGGWGTHEVVGMSWHRARTFPGRMGRLRLAGVIDAEHVEYESRLGRWRPAVASRYSRRLGAIELGVSAYDGTSREPFLEPVIGPHGEPGLVQPTTRRYAKPARTSR